MNSSTNCNWLCVEAYEVMLTCYIVAQINSYALCINIVYILYVFCGLVKITSFNRSNRSIIFTSAIVCCICTQFWGSTTVPWKTSLITITTIIIKREGWAHQLVLIYYTTEAIYPLGFQYSWCGFIICIHNFQQDGGADTLKAWIQQQTENSGKIPRQRLIWGKVGS